MLTASASPATAIGRTITSTATATLTQDSAGGAVSSAQLGAFDGLPVTWTDPQPTGATVSPATSSVTAGSATTTYNCSATCGAGHVIATLDHSSVTVVIPRPPVVTLNPTNQTVAPGNPVTFAASASGVPTPTVQWQRSTDGGVSFTNITGATSTSYTFTVATGDNGNQYRAVFSNGVGSPAATTAATLTAGTAPVITSSNNTSFVVGQAGSFTITTTGVPSAALSRTGSQFPAWLTLTDNGNGTGTLTGTPPAGSGGSYGFTLTAVNGVGTGASQNFTLFVDDSPVITSGDHTTFTVGSAGTFTVTSTAGYPASTMLAVSGSLPSGTSFIDNGNGTATLAGTPAAGTGGSYPVTITATAVGGLASPATQSFTLTVLASPVITSADNATFAVGSAGSFTVTTSAGYPTATMLTRTGALASGITFVDNGNGTASIAGTPNTGGQGVYTITITASNASAPDTSQTFTLTVNASPTITSANHATFTVNAAASFTVTTTGKPTSSLAETGALPSGVTFTDNGNGTATLAGTPATGTGGSYPLTLTAANSVGSTTQAFTLTVNTPPVITSPNSTTFAVGSAGTFPVTTTAGTPATTTLTEAGALPSGVTFTDNGDGTATLAGIPAAGTGGSYTLTLTAGNGVLPNAAQNFTLTVTELPVISSANDTTFSANTAGSFTVTTSGYPAVTTLTETGALPSGVTFTDNGNGTATLAGTPTAGSTRVLTLTATNSVGSTTQAFTLTVNAPPAITTANNTTFTQGQAGTFTVKTSGYPKPTLTESGALPAGVTFTDNGNGTATLAGTSSTKAIFALTITANNGISPAASQSFTLTVAAPPPVTVGSVPSQLSAVGVAESLQMTASGGIAPYTWSATGLPTGLSINSSTGLISGSPSAVGTFSSTVTARDSASVSGSTSFTWTVRVIAVTNPGNQTGYVGVRDTLIMKASGGTTPYTWSATGLPPGKTLTATNGWITGYPYVAGTYQVKVTAKDSTGATGSVSFTWTVSTGPFTVTNPGNQADVIGAAIQALSVDASGGTGNYAWSATGLPPGLTLGTSTGRITGTPTTVGTYSVNVTVRDSASHTGSVSFSWYISPMQIADPGTQQWEVGVPVNSQMQLLVNGSPPYTWSASNLPNNVTISATTGLISGTPNSNNAGQQTTVWVTDSTGSTAAITFTQSVADPVQLNSVGSPNLVVGQSYQVMTFPTRKPAGVGPYTFSATNLPPGFTISSAGLISGTATTAGTYPVTVVVTDAAGGTDSSSGTWTVNP